MVNRRIFSLLALSVVAAPALCNITISVPETSFSERYAENIEVSGSILASSFVKGSLVHAAPDQLYVYIPSPSSMLTIILSSIDGRYSADAQIELSSEQVGWLQLQIPTRHQTKFVAYLPDRLVAFAFIDSEDIFGNYVQEVFPTSWGAPKDTAISFFINSAGVNPNITFRDSDGDVKTKDCTGLNDEYTRVFNHICDFGEKTVPEKVTVTFSPEYDSSGKNYVIWTLDGK
jgi:hypothetical protein